MFGNRTKSYSLKVFGKSDYRTNNYESVFSLLRPRRFPSRLSGEYTVFTKIYERGNATGVISLLAVVIKNKQMKYIERNRTESNKIEQIEGLNSIEVR